MASLRIPVTTSAPSVQGMRSITPCARSYTPDARVATPVVRSVTPDARVPPQVPSLPLAAMQAPPMPIPVRTKACVEPSCGLTPTASTATPSVTPPGALPAGQSTLGGRATMLTASAPQFKGGVLRGQEDPTAGLPPHQRSQVVPPWISQAVGGVTEPRQQVWNLHMGSGVCDVDNLYKRGVGAFSPERGMSNAGPSQRRPPRAARSPLHQHSRQESTSPMPEGRTAGIRKAPCYSLQPRQSSSSPMPEARSSDKPRSLEVPLSAGWSLPLSSPPPPSIAATGWVPASSTSAKEQDPTDLSKRSGTPVITRAESLSLTPGISRADSLRLLHQHGVIDVDKQMKRGLGVHSPLRAAQSPTLGNGYSTSLSAALPVGPTLQGSRSKSPQKNDSTVSLVQLGAGSIRTEDIPAASTKVDTLQGVRQSSESVLPTPQSREQCWRPKQDLGSRRAGTSVEPQERAAWGPPKPHIEGPPPVSKEPMTEWKSGVDSLIGEINDLKAEISHARHVTEKNQCDVEKRLGVEVRTQTFSEDLTASMNSGLINKKDVQAMQAQLARAIAYELKAGKRGRTPFGTVGALDAEAVGGPKETSPPPDAKESALLKETSLLKRLDSADRTNAGDVSRSDSAPRGAGLRHSASRPGSLIADMANGCASPTTEAEDAGGSTLRSASQGEKRHYMAPDNKLRGPGTSGSLGAPPGCRGNRKDEHTPNSSARGRNRDYEESELSSHLKSILWRDAAAKGNWDIDFTFKRRVGEFSPTRAQTAERQRPVTRRSSAPARSHSPVPRDQRQQRKARVLPDGSPRQSRASSGSPRPGRLLGSPRERSPRQAWGASKGARRRECSESPAEGWRELGLFPDGDDKSDKVTTPSPTKSRYDTPARQSPWSRSLLRGPSHEIPEMRTCHGSVEFNTNGHVKDPALASFADRRSRFEVSETAADSKQDARNLCQSSDSPSMDNHRVSKKAPGQFSPNIGKERPPRSPSLGVRSDVSIETGGASPARRSKGRTAWREEPSASILSAIGRNHDAPPEPPEPKKSVKERGFRSTGRPPPITSQQLHRSSSRDLNASIPNLKESTGGSLALPAGKEATRQESICSASTASPNAKESVGSASTSDGKARSDLAKWMRDLTPPLDTRSSPGLSLSIACQSDEASSTASTKANYESKSNLLTVDNSYRVTKKLAAFLSESGSAASTPPTLKNSKRSLASLGS